MGKSRYVITVQRQFGSMGRPIAKKMAEILGIEYYDRDLVDQAAKQLDLPVSLVDEQEENAKVSNVENPFFRMKFPLGRGVSDMQNKIFQAQENIIRFLADKETCVIVGRCSDFILSERKDSIHIYIYAPYEERVKHCVNDLHMELQEARKMIVEVDKARASYHMNYAGFLPEDPNYKNILIDSSFLGVEGTAQYLAEAVRRKWPKSC